LPVALAADTWVVARMAWVAVVAGRTCEVVVVEVLPIVAVATGVLVVEMVALEHPFK